MEAVHWITSTKRLVQEGMDMGHCVGSYGPYISKDADAIYSLVYQMPGSRYNGVRYTVEFMMARKGDQKYYVNQIQRKFDRGCPDEVRKYVESFLK